MPKCQLCAHKHASWEAHAPIPARTYDDPWSDPRTGTDVKNVLRSA